MTDKYEYLDGVDTPSRDMFLVTPHDTNAVNPVPKALRFDGAGAVTLRAVDSGDDVTINVVAGEVLSVRAEYVRDTGTDAIVIHGLG